MSLDPRTVAREIPGIFNEIFPQLTPGIVAHLNNSAITTPVDLIQQTELFQSKLQRAMLFELSCTLAERLIAGDTHINWTYCFSETIRKQCVYYDAKLPDELTSLDKTLAETVGRNLARLINEMRQEYGHPIVIRPKIPGLEWIASGYGDFALGRTLIEVKCTAKRFSSADYRQVAIYWLLSYAGSVENRSIEWTDFALINPRNGAKVAMTFDSFLSIISSGRTKVDILQLFLSLVGSRLKH